MASDSTKKLAGLLMLILVSMVLLSMLQTESKIIASQVVKNTREFDLGEKITIFELPEILTKEQKNALELYATTEFFQDDLPDGYIVKGERDLLAEQQATQQLDPSLNNVTNGTQSQTFTEQDKQSDTFKAVKTSEITSARNANLIQENAVQGNIHDRGGIIKIAGKIEMARSTPYFFNVHMTCCGMDTFRVISSAETDSAGNFVVKITTTPKFPLGDWIVTIGTIGDDNKIIKHYYNFKLIDTSINFES